MQQPPTRVAAKAIAAAGVAVAILTGLAACQGTGDEVTVGAPGEEAAASNAGGTGPGVSETTAIRDDAADDGGGLPADGALLSAAEQESDPGSQVDRATLDEQAQQLAALSAAQTTTTTAPPAPPTTVAAVAPTTTAPAAAPAPTVTAPPPPAEPTNGSMTGAEAAFLSCVRARESGGNYSVVSANGLYYGAYQFARSTWDSTASHAGRGDLVGVAPNTASPADQDAMALHLYRWQGSAPWGGFC